MIVHRILAGLAADAVLYGLPERATAVVIVVHYQDVCHGASECFVPVCWPPVHTRVTAAATDPGLPAGA